jgi:hypothetical protein
MSRHPVLTILMVVVGIILLLPGVCAAFFIAAGGIGSIGSEDALIVALWVACFLIAAGGVWLLVRAFR